jgi:glycosyltransferase involved in cell wall biosynthesis
MNYQKTIPVNKPDLNRKPKLLYFVTEDWYFWSHRLALARAARDSGFEVVVITRVNDYKTLIEQEGFKLIPINLVRGSLSLFRELSSIIEIIKIYLREKPDIAHHVALKPILYGSFTAKFARTSVVINLFAGITTRFHAQKWKSRILGLIAWLGFRSAFSGKNVHAVFQNSSNMKSFLDKGFLSENQAELIRGSGVDTAQFIPTPEPEGIPRIILASRMLWDKGVGEFVEASKILKHENIECRMILVGSPDPENPASIDEHILKDWNSEGVIEWWGQQNKMHEIFPQSNIVCLPSYQEGGPKVLLEASSCGRAVVTTDQLGCKEMVLQGLSGILVPIKDSKALANAIKELILDPDLRKKMGECGRELVLNNFSEEIIINETLGLYNRLLIEQKFAKP